MHGWIKYTFQYISSYRLYAKLLCCKPRRYGAPFPLEPKVKRVGLYTNGALCRYTSALLLTRELLNSSTVLCTHLSRFADMNSLYIAEPGPGPLDYESNSFIWPLLRSVRYMYSRSLHRLVHLNTRNTLCENVCTIPFSRYMQNLQVSHGYTLLQP